MPTCRTLSGADILVLFPFSVGERQGGVREGGREGREGGTCKKEGQKKVV